MNYKRILVSLLAVSVATSSVVPAFGASNEITEPFPNSGDSNITLEVKDTTSEGGGGSSGGGGDGDDGDGGDPINVIVATVPAELPIVMDVNTGEITVPSDAKIINHDADKDIKVTDIEVTSSGDWAIADFDDDFTSKPDNTKEMGLQFRGDNLETSGKFTLTSDNWVIGASSELPLNMKAKLPKQTEESKGSIAKASFTLDWSDGSGGSATQPDESNISVQWDNSPMLPNSKNTATFNWDSTDPENKIVSIESLDPTIASVPEFSEASLMSLSSGTKAVEVTAHQKGSTSIVATLASGETAEAKVDVYEIEGNTSDGSIEVTVPGEGYEEGATVGGDSSIEIQIPVQGPDGEDTITVTPEIPETELQPGDNKVEVEVDINGVKVKITIVINVAIKNPSDGLQQSVEEAQAMGFTFSSYEDGLQIDSFTNTQSKSEINVPEQIGDFKVLKIGDNVFENQTNLVSITIPNTIEYIGFSAFEGCVNLKSFYIPSSVKYMGSAFFKAGLNVPDSTLIVGSNLEDNSHGGYYETSGFHKLIVLDGVKSVGRDLVGGSTTIEYVDLGKDVKSIGVHAFSSCSNLISVEVPDGLKSIEPSAFKECSKLNSIDLPNGLETIGMFAFEESGLTAVNIPNSVTELGNESFRGCSKLKSVKIGNGVSSIGSSTFNACVVLSSVTIGDGVRSIKWNAFTSCPKLLKLTIPDGVTSIDSLAFDDTVHLYYNGKATGAPWGASGVN